MTEDMGASTEADAKGCITFLVSGVLGLAGGLWGLSLVVTPDFLQWSTELPLNLGLPVFVLTALFAAAIGFGLPVVIGAWLFDIRDSDGSGEVGETGTGSTEGDSAGPQGIAQETTA